MSRAKSATAECTERDVIEESGVHHKTLSCAGSGARVHVGSGVVRMDPIRFLARCRKRRLNQALSVLSLSMWFLSGVFCAAY